MRDRIAIGLVAVCGIFQTFPARAAGLPTLRTIRQVHLLSTEQAQRRYPVHVQGVITYYDPFLNHPRRPIIMVTDKTATIYVAIPGETDMPLHPGTLLDVKGVSGPGDFAPTIDDARITILGNAPLPEYAPHETLTHMLSGVVDAQWSELEGIVESVEYSGNNVTLKLVLDDGEIAATTVLQSGVDYNRFIDARVRIRGIAGSLFTRNRQIIGVQLLFSGVQTIQVLEPAPSDPMQMPVSSISQLMTYVPGESVKHRIHLRGVVTLSWPGRLLCIQEGAMSLCAKTSQIDALTPGSIVDVTGFPAIGSVTPTLRNTTYRPYRGKGNVLPLAVTADEALSGKADARLVQIEGRVLAMDRTSADHQIVLRAGQLTYPIVLADSQRANAMSELQEGSLVRVTGICSVHANANVFTRHDGYPVPQSFQILLRSAGDVSVVEMPSWFTIRHVLYLLAGLLFLTLVALAWAVLLRHRVKLQTKQLLHQATHDALTGLCNRRAILDLLPGFCAGALREKTSVGVMMIDADHFKKINDTYGHLAGDDVLRTIAQRISDVLHPDDVAGRYGGEEFVVVLPRCTAPVLASRAAQVLGSIASEPVLAADFHLIVTVSIGTALSGQYMGSLNEFFSAADKALYAAKAAGRNRVVSAALDVEATAAHKPHILQCVDPASPNEFGSLTPVGA